MKEFIPDKSQLHPPGTVEEEYRRIEENIKAFWGKDTGSLDPEKVEKVSCSLCSAPPPPASTAIFKKFHFPYFQCPSCTLTYPSPRPKMEYIDAQYKNGRFARSYREIYLPSAPYRMATIFRERVEEIIMPRVPKGKLLDIGCSSGHFLKVAFNRGYDVYGIEPNLDMVEFATKELGLPNIICGILQENTYPIDYFDVVTLWDVLEHIPNPAAVLHIVLNLLKPNGWVFAYTENVESFNVFITGGDSEIFSPDVHLRHYSPKTFRMEFEKAGFKGCEILTKGLDIQHIETTVKLHPGKYPQKELQYLFRNGNHWQNIINACGKGDNLRLFAQKDA